MLFEPLKVFQIKDATAIKKHQIISKRIFQDQEVTFYLFSFDENESVSEQSNSEDIFIQVLEGTIQVFQDKVYEASAGQVLGIPKNTLHTVHSKTKSKILQISLEANKGEEMGQFISKINDKQVMRLCDAIEAEENGVSSMALVQRQSFTLTLMAFSKDAKIASHRSTGDALVQILEGRAHITVDGEEFEVKSGESLLMPAGIPHALFAVEPFKMLLTVAKPEA